MTSYSLFDAGPITIFFPLFWVILVVWILLWIALPFGVFGVKKRLDRVIDLLEDQQRSASLILPSEEQSGTLGGGAFENLLRKLPRIRHDFSVDRPSAGRADLWLTSGLQRIRIAEIRERPGGLELELSLDRLFAGASSFRSENLLALIEERLSDRPGIRILSDRKGDTLMIQIDSGGETMITDLMLVLQSEVFDLLPN